MSVDHGPAHARGRQKIVVTLAELAVLLRLQAGAQVVDVYTDPGHPGSAGWLSGQLPTLHVVFEPTEPPAADVLTGELAPDQRLGILLELAAFHFADDPMIRAMVVRDQKLLASYRLAVSAVNDPTSELSQFILQPRKTILSAKREEVAVAIAFWEGPVAAAARRG